MKLFRTKGAQENAPRRRQTQIADEQERPSAVDLENRYAFRRNRTLTGSSSANVASSNELNAELRSPRARIHHLSSLRRRLLGYLFAVAILAFLLYYLLSQFTASVTVQVAGMGTLDNDEAKPYQVAAEEYFAARPVERLRFVLHRTEFLSHMQASRPEIKRLNLEGSGQLGGTLLTITSRTAIARWSISGADQYVDSEGTVFSKNYGTIPSLEIVDNSGVRTSDSRFVASRRFLGFVGRAIGLASQNNIIVRKVTIPAFTTRELALNVKGTRTAYKLSIDRAVGEQIEDMVRVARYMQRHKKNPSYVDVRIQGKAFYK